MIGKFDWSVIQEHHIHPFGIEEPGDCVLKLRLNGETILVGLIEDRKIVVAHRANLPR